MTAVPKGAAKSLFETLAHSAEQDVSMDSFFKDCPSEVRVQIEESMMKLAKKQGLDGPFNELPKTKLVQLFSKAMMVQFQSDSVVRKATLALAGAADQSRKGKRQCIGCKTDPMHCMVRAKELLESTDGHNGGQEGTPVPPLTDLVPTGIPDKVMSDICTRLEDYVCDDVKKMSMRVAKQFSAAKLGLISETMGKDVTYLLSLEKLKGFDLSKLPRPRHASSCSNVCCAAGKILPVIFDCGVRTRLTHVHKLMYRVNRNRAPQNRCNAVVFDFPTLEHLLWLCANEEKSALPYSFMTFTTVDVLRTLYARFGKLWARAEAPSVERLKDPKIKSSFIVYTTVHNANTSYAPHAPDKPLHHLYQSTSPMDFAALDKRKRGRSRAPLTPEGGVAAPLDPPSAAGEKPSEPVCGIKETTSAAEKSKAEGRYDVLRDSKTGVTMRSTGMSDAESQKMLQLVLDVKSKGQSIDLTFTPGASSDQGASGTETGGSRGDGSPPSGDGVPPTFKDVTREGCVTTISDKIMSDICCRLSEYVCDDTKFMDARIRKRDIAMQRLDEERDKDAAYVAGYLRLKSIDLKPYAKGDTTKAFAQTSLEIMSTLFQDSIVPRLETFHKIVQRVNRGRSQHDRCDSVVFDFPDISHMLWFCINNGGSVSPYEFMCVTNLAVVQKSFDRFAKQWTKRSDMSKRRFEESKAKSTLAVYIVVRNRPATRKMVHTYDPVDILHVSECDVDFETEARRKKSKRTKKNSTQEESPRDASETASAENSIVSDNTESKGYCKGVKGERSSPERPRRLLTTHEMYWTFMDTAPPTKQDIARHCANCGARPKRMKKCGNCKCILYCSQECAHNDWKEVHGDFCKDAFPKGCS